MKSHRGYINLYESGYYHRKGKPGTLDVYAADVYATAQQAMQMAEPGRGYIGTVPLVWLDSKDRVANPPDSQPIPLRETRKDFKDHHSW